MDSRIARVAFFALVAGVVAGPAAGLLPGQSSPLRLYSAGDSITRAFDSVPE